MIKPIFGRSKWGQNDVQLFITIYCPGIDVTKLDDMLTVDDEKFFFEAVDPVNNEKSTVSFDFREPVDASSISVRPGTWKYGNANNTVFVTVKKQIPHLFDRLTFAKPTKAFKKMMEKDWDRYTVNESEGDEEEEEEDEDDDDDQDVKKVTDDSYDKELKKASVLALKVLYPWCEACKGNKIFDDAARKQKKIKGLKGVRYGRVDARENRKIRKLVGAHCPEVKNCQDHVYLVSKDWSEGPFRFNGTDFSASGVATYIDKLGSPSPRLLSSLDDLHNLEKRNQNIIIGVFDTKRDAKALTTYKLLATKQRMQQYFGLVTEETITSTPEQLNLWLQAALTGSGLSEEHTDIVIDHSTDLTAEGGRIVVLSRFDDSAKSIGRSHVSMYGQRSEDGMEMNEIESFVNTYATNKALVQYQRADITSGAKVHVANGRKFLAHLWIRSGSDRLTDSPMMVISRKLAQAYHRDVAFMVHDEVKETGQAVIGKNVSTATKTQLYDFGMDGSERSLFAMEAYNEATSGFDKRYAMGHVSSKTTEDEFMSFIKSVMDGTAKEALRSEPLPDRSKETGSLVKRVVGTELGSISKEGGGTGIISFHYGLADADPRRMELDLVARALRADGSKYEVLQCSLTYNAVTGADAELQVAAKNIHLAYYAEGGQVKTMPHGNQTAEALMVFLLEASGGNWVTSPLMAQLVTLRLTLGSSHATVYEHGDFNGWAVGMGRGDYDDHALRELGVVNDDLSSVKVDVGSKVTLFEHGNFTGWECELAEGNNRVSALETAFCKNDEASAMRVEPAVAADRDILTATPTTCQVKIIGESSLIRGGVWRANLINGKWGTEAYELRGGINDEAASVIIPEGCIFTTFEHDFGPEQATGWTKSLQGTGQTMELTAGASAFSIMGQVAAPAPPGADDDSVSLPEDSSLLKDGAEAKEL